VSAAILALAGDVRAQDTKVEASMLCDRAPEPGRVRCFVEVRAPSDHTITWADVVIQKVPDFVTPLKGRLGDEDATAKEGARWRWAFGIVAKKTGQGEARALVRIVSCEGKRCTPISSEVRATITVGG
jgi:hypothetical protein